MTEVCGVVAMTPKESVGGDQVPAGSVGVPMAGIELKICSLDDGTSLGPGKPGEVLVRSAFNMRGYVKNEQATHNAIDAQGWLHTRDYGYVDKKGYVFVVDRVEDLIICQGHTVVPSELESLLLNHEAVADAGVVGIPNVEAGEVPCAWVVLKPETSMLEEELQAWMEESVPPHRKLRGGIKFVPEIPVMHRKNTSKSDQENHARKDE